MFFYFSGRSAAFSKDGHLLFTKKKILRLILPLIFGTIIYVIPTAYIGREYRPCINSEKDMTFFDFVAKYFVDEFPKNGFEWLWFLPVLFGIQMIT